MDEMTVRLHADDAYYCSMLELIPAKLYFHKNEEEKLMSTRFYKVSGIANPLAQAPQHPPHSYRADTVPLFPVPACHRTS